MGPMSARLAMHRLLHLKRQQWQDMQVAPRRQALKEVQALHQEAVRLQALLLASDPGSHDEIYRALLANAFSRGSGHVIVFCLDESGSMEDPLPSTASAKWDLVVAALNKFGTNQTAKGCGGDPAAIVQFSDTARITRRVGPLASVTSGSFQLAKGGTKFHPPLSEAQGLFKEMLTMTPSRTPVLVFMSDGRNDDGEVTSTMSTLLQDAPSLVLHGIFFGPESDAGHTRMRSLVATMPESQGHFHRAGEAENVSLQFVFEDIAKDITAL